MGNYITHTLGTSTLDLNDYMGAESISSLLDDLETTAKKQAAINDAIDGAEGVVDSYLGGRYDVPVTTPIRAIRDAAGVLSAHNLYSRSPNGPPQAIEDRYDEKMAWLKDVSTSKAHIIGADAQPTPPGGGSVASFSGNTRQMTRSKLEWY